MLDALIFDVDGTLAETERDAHRVAFNRAFADFGIDWYWDVATYGKLLSVAGGKERLRHFMRMASARMPLLRDPDALVAQLHARKTEHYGAMVADGGLAPRPGVLRLICQARARGIRLAIASTTSRPNVDALLASWFGAQWHEVFRVIGAGDVVPRKKPDPGIYQWVLERLGVPAHRCLAIEDSAAGLAAASGAGLAAVITRSTYFRGQSFDGAIAVLDDLGEPGQPSRGQANGAAWSGFVDLDTLQDWLAAHRRADSARPRDATLTLAG
jgi:HAD superfamily hydrolase (TIGR01509 family)